MRSEQFRVILILLVLILCAGITERIRKTLYRRLCMKTAVVVDSHSSITPEEAGRLGIFLLPAPFLIDGVNYYENENITREKFFELLTSGASVSTYQPTPES